MLFARWRHYFPRLIQINYGMMFRMKKENVIYAQFGKDLFNISKVIGRKKVTQFFWLTVYIYLLSFSDFLCPSLETDRYWYLLDPIITNFCVFPSAHIIRPNLARMSDSMLESLVFLHCNSHLSLYVLKIVTIQLQLFMFCNCSGLVEWLLLFQCKRTKRTKLTILFALLSSAWFSHLMSWCFFWTVIFNVRIDFAHFAFLSNCFGYSFIDIMVLGWHLMERRKPT